MPERVNPYDIAEMRRFGNSTEYMSELQMEIMAKDFDPKDSPLFSLSFSEHTEKKNEKTQKKSTQ